MSTFNLTLFHYSCNLTMTELFCWFIVDGLRGDNDMNNPLKKLIMTAVKQCNELTWEFGKNDLDDKLLKNILLAVGAISVDISEDEERMTVILPN